MRNKSCKSEVPCLPNPSSGSGRVEKPPQTAWIRMLFFFSLECAALPQIYFCYVNWTPATALASFIPFKMASQRLLKHFQRPFVRETFKKALSIGSEMLLLGGSSSCLLRAFAKFALSQRRPIANGRYCHHPLQLTLAGNASLSERMHLNFRT